jgi:hypothetical protein
MSAGYSGTPLPIKLFGRASVSSSNATATR